MRFRFAWAGKTKDASLRSLQAEYAARISRLVPIQIAEVRDAGRGKRSLGASAVRDEASLLEKVMSRSSLLVTLDEKGSELTSPGFAAWLQNADKSGAREITFIVGGPDGLDETIRRRANLSLALGRMTWTHEMCRVLLLEQVYRSLCILRNIPYHK